MTPFTPRRAILAAPAIVLSLVLFAAPSQAQYMYLDSNGDGVHTAADVLRSTGTTFVDVWVRTDMNRDGSIARCDAPGESNEPLTINSYVYILRATGGTVAYGTPANRRQEMTLHFFGYGSNSTDLVEGWGGGTIDPPGLYRVSSFTIAVLSGTPSVSFVPSSSLTSDVTSFGTHCSGIDFDNTYKLGGDFLDSDGLPYSPGGPPNTAPVISALSDMVVGTGETAWQSLSAQDADGDGISFSKEAGPGYVSVSTVEAGPGVGTGRVTARPHTADVGAAEVTIAATDGAATSRASFQITVVAVPNHAPRLDVPAEIRVEAGAVARQLIYVGDSDGDALTVYKVSGPSFAAVESPGTGAGGAYANVAVSPGACDIGQAALTIGSSDGTDATEAVVQLKVIEPQPRPTPDTRTFPGVSTPFGVLTADWNEDGHLDVATVDAEYGYISIFVGDGEGNLVLSASYPGGPAGAGAAPAATGDWNLDGHADLAVASFGSSVSILLGVGNGTFVQGQTIEVLSELDAVGAADLDHDGVLDLVIAGGGYAVAIGRGDGTFVAGPVLSLGGRATSIALGDFNRDGVVDFAAPVGPVVRAFLGRGDGTFEAGASSLSTESYFTVAAADLNWDGYLDLVGFGWESKVQPLLGHGTGSFTLGSGVDLGAVSYPWTGAVGDWNGDGCDDAISVSLNTSILHVIRGDGQGNLVMPPLAALSGPGAYMGAVTGDFNEDGRADIAYGGNGLILALNTRPPRSTTTARTFLVGGANALPTVPSARQVPFYIEPTSGGFDVTALDLSTIRLHSEGTGSVASIAPSAGKTAVVGDVDANGVQEIAVSFASTELSKLFDGVHGRQEVPVSLDGSLYTGGKICSRFALNLVGAGPRDLAVAVAPNPLNPTATLSFETTKPGPVQVRLFDVQGRVIRVLLDTPMAAPTRYTLPIDGMDGGGRRLATGVYFFRVSAEGVERRGRFVVLK